MRGLRNIRLATLNIRYGRTGGLEAALRALRQDNVGVGFLQETILTDGIQVRKGEGYFICMTEAESSHRGEILVLWREDAGWQVQGIVNFSPNVASLLMTLGSRRWYVVGAYAPPTLCDSHPSHSAGSGGGTEGNGGNPVGGYQRKSEGTAG